MASWLGHTQIVISLLRAGADPNIPEEVFKKKKLIVFSNFFSNSILYFLKFILRHFIVQHFVDIQKLFNNLLKAGLIQTHLIMKEFCFVF